ncbi:MAG: ZIP family metal transporter [Candidatus Woesearchaeota archaeon]|nr:ZIP family metal transporter [Candidatus Aenigmarchaeota archaeon]MBU5689390.1 ZIP family metal transporter [Candidatus Aenigmarchaeota archaeon]
MLEIILSIFIISIISVVGLILIFFKKFDYEKNIYYMISFAAGTMLAASFFEVIPESLEATGTVNYIFLGIILFLFIEKYIHWHHCNRESCEDKHKKVKPYVFLNLLGDGLHNFIDGAIITAAYMTNFELGLLTTISVAVHELPQEIGDFSILLKGGLKFRKALLFNFLTALTAFLGMFFTIFAGNYIENINPILLSIAAGGFIYLALSDIIPETHKETESKKIFKQTLFLILGIILVYLLIMLVPE